MVSKKGEWTTKQKAIIEKTIEYFNVLGRVPTRREYDLMPDRPVPTGRIERLIGWGEIKRLAIEEIKPAAEPPPSDPPIVDSKLMSGDDYDRLSIMAGLKKVGLPKRYREMLGNLVLETEHCFLKLPRYSLPERSSNLESAILLLSDLHSGKSIFDDQENCLYNRDIMTFRMGLLKEQVCSIIDERMAMGRLDEFVMALIGDIVDGSGVYPGQELNQDLSCFVPQITLAVACIWDLIVEIRKRNIPVRVNGVRGNHGRQYKYANAGNNFDYLVLQMLYMLAYTYDRKGVSVKYSTAPYMNFEVKGFRCHIRHEAPVQTETPAAKAKFMGWRAMHEYDLIFYGHKHHPGNGSVLDCDAFMNGSLVGTDDLSESLAVFSRPSQTLVGIDPGFGRTYAYNLYADKFSSKGEAARLLKRYPFLNTPFNGGTA